jgi:hypothetical protein
MYNFCRKFNKLVILIMEMPLACGFLLLLLIHPLPIYAQTLLIFFPAQVTLRNLGNCGLPDDELHFRPKNLTV